MSYWEYVCVPFDKESEEDQNTCAAITDEYDCGIEGKGEDAAFGSRGTCEWVEVEDDKPTGIFFIVL